MEEEPDHIKVSMPISDAQAFIHFQHTADYIRILLANQVQQPDLGNPNPEEEARTEEEPEDEEESTEDADESDEEDEDEDDSDDEDEDDQEDEDEEDEEDEEDDE
ncbi:phage protein [Geomicrobium sp. JCM 19037]|uniref:hypothetical protein n=1 Tax=Geomicrobium sp. JCM 19037 TaxID=1460634 RepID=UPI00045F4483|nr:hypothetical protein [Geomicrobium sp. JCM 19037]GAK06088.1 phage protein [Geomicrobium sp. JCM 19037]